MKHRIITLSLFLLVVITLFSCMRVETVVTVNNDGSGTIDLNMAMTRAASAMFTNFNLGDTSDDEEQPETNPFSKEDFEKRVAEYGEGVTLVEYGPYSNEKYIGGLAVYSFDDITKIKVNPFPSDDNAGKSEKDDESVFFKFTKKGKKRKLIVCVPDEKKEEKDKTEKTKEMSDADKKNKEMTANFLKDMYVSLTVIINGKVSKNDAKNLEGNKLKVMEIDFNTILNDETLYDTLMDSDDPDVLKKVNGQKGIIFQDKDEVFIEFK